MPTKAPKIKKRFAPPSMKKGIVKAKKLKPEPIEVDIEPGETRATGSHKITSKNTMATSVYLTLPVNAWDELDALRIKLYKEGNTPGITSKSGMIAQLIIEGLKAHE